MNHDLLCTWLNLTEKGWPPEPHALLGVKPGEVDIALIEQRVHERLCRLRCFQVTHPEEATEGMNRLAQAFIQVTDSISRELCKKAVPVTVMTAKLPGATVRPASPEPLKREIARADTSIPGKAESDWRNAPPPVRAGDTMVRKASVQDTMNAPMSSLTDTVSDIPPVPSAPPPEPDPSMTAAAMAQLACDLARGEDARKKLKTLNRLLGRVAQTRTLANTWKRVAKYVRNPQRAVAKAAEEADLARRMDALFEVMEDYPPFFGRPGKPGYRVVAMARLEKTAHMFKVLDLQQREELSRDWEAGESLIREHRRFLLESLKAWKRRSRSARMLSLLSDFVHEQVVAVAVASAVIAVLAMMVILFWN